MKAECPKMKINGCQEHKYCNKNNPTENDFDYTFQIGAATTAGSVHVDHLIKILGRWSSDAYCRYTTHYKNTRLGN
jgi:hypothetical protein